MKKKPRRLKISSTHQTAADGCEGRKTEDRETLLNTTDSLTPERTAMDTNSHCSVIKDDEEKDPESKSRCSAGRTSSAVCRLCHGKFSARSLRHAFSRWPPGPLRALDPAAPSPLLDPAAPSPLPFHSDFQRLVGVQLDRDPRLSDFICKRCHTKFYKCHSILWRFLQRVNLPALGTGNRRNLKGPNTPANDSPGKPPCFPSSEPPCFASDPECLHSLVGWAHRHGEACTSCPDLKEVLEGRCGGSLRAVWGCADGHRYIMDTRNAAAGYLGDQVDYWGGASWRQSNEEVGVEKVLDGRMDPGTQQNQDDWAEGFPEEVTSPGPGPLQDRTADSDLSDRVISEEELQENRARSDEEMFDPVQNQRTSRLSRTRRRQKPKTSEEPRVRKKPGPKPGWKNQFRPKGEELPNIYKCPYQGCTAVYRAPDGLKKHIKEHHEDMRERPCPHPGCNKVFMIDRYLQRHIKLIHTEERNYICDQCGQTFKQRKHLSVHQMRHSGAKPLQCEVCGFQCRQRASLKYHMTKHKAESDLAFECRTCRKRFEKPHNLNVHMSMVHPPVLAEARQAGPVRLQTIGLTGELVPQDQDR
ncbi:zinc finger protein 276 isoform X1 [Gambusia affinis]|uniref:zinc finger protein 276 isoform X1 n=1 Tax=Gambusia affinis TaxID=33528 RepID=UPI001CDBBB24|nr:zinc finger protein 276 isoform X1 [Gambusia affinis]XP_043980312.1 zinc finger protein 276 isoform X1 [Gambusia affinis]XP_043980313.1 zinc finger protein 276 isoform X1 [Gambusia affinis]XP_043980314.1 zinc finger protein 276 isoform X1 [Gambusia affinis]